MPGRDGLLHISQLRKIAGGKRVENVEDVVKVGDKVQVEIAEIDPRGKLSLVPVVEGEGDGAPTPSPRGEPVEAAADDRRRLSGSTTATAQRPARPGTLLREADGGLVRRTVLPGGLRVRHRGGARPSAR